MSFSHPMKQKFPVGSLVIHEVNAHELGIHLVYGHLKDHVMLLLLYRDGGMANQFTDFDDLFLNYEDVFPLLTGEALVDEFRGYNQLVQFQTLRTHGKLFTLEEMLAREAFPVLNRRRHSLRTLQKTFIGSQIHPLPKTPANGL